jgi:hypothetical protein
MLLALLGLDWTGLTLAWRSIIQRGPCVHGRLRPESYCDSGSPIKVLRQPFHLRTQTNPRCQDFTLQDFTFQDFTFQDFTFQDFTYQGSAPFKPPER